MPTQSLTLSQRLSAFLARKIVWLWPQETKEWALAFEAELPEITTPLASARWVIGGAALLARESLRQFFKSLWRPLGVAAPGDPSAFAGNGGPAPRLPRVFAGLFVLASFAMLCLPEVRASLGSSLLFGQTRIHEYFQQRNIQKLRDQARANHDPQLLAFLSLALSYDNERYSLADEAIRRDPSLTWVDYSVAWWFWSDTDRSHFLSDERIARLHTYDPQNAAPLLLTAEVISRPVKVATYFSTSQSTPIGAAPPWERAITKNAAWLAAMDRAFQAPQFHDYFAQQVELARQVRTRYHISDPEIMQDTLYATLKIDDGMNIEAYSHFLVRRGDEAAQRKDWSHAIEDYEKVQHFAEKIPAGDEYKQAYVARIGGPAAKKLELALQATNHPKEAQIAAAKSATWDKANAELQSHLRQTWGESRGRPWSKAEQAGLLINLAVLLIAVVFPVAAVALLSVGLAAALSRRIFGRLYPLICLAADAAPIVLVLSFALLLFVYHPYANPFQNVASQEDLWVAAAVSHELPRSVWLVVLDTFYIHGRYYFWVGLTGLLSLVALFLLYRMVSKGRNPETKRLKT